MQVLRLFDPFGAVHTGVVHFPRVRSAHPRLQNSSAPTGPLASSRSRHHDAMGAGLIVIPTSWRSEAPAPASIGQTDARGWRPQRGSHYSITAGERSEPADGESRYTAAPKGSNRHTACTARPGRRQTESCRNSGEAGGPKGGRRGEAALPMAWLRGLHKKEASGDRNPEAS